MLFPGVISNSRDNSGHVQGALRDGVLGHNLAAADLASIVQALTTDNVLAWFSVPNAGVVPLSAGSTTTQLSTGGFTGFIAGVFQKKAAVAAGTAFTAQTVPADQWALYAVDSDGSTITITAAAANTTGYATEALAIAALPARVAGKARLGYITLKTKAATAWVAVTDSLAGGATGNPASITNYYPQAATLSPNALMVESAGMNYTNTGGPFTGGYNGILIGSVLSRGSTDTNLATTAFTFNANGFTNLAKAAVAAGTAFGALGTIPASTWGLIVQYIDATGAITYKSGPQNYGAGYATEATALADLPLVSQPAGLARIGYITVKASASTWVAGTDALAGGASGNPATTTNYYAQAGVTYPAGLTTKQVGDSSSAPFAPMTS